jgi:hypothetical protein
VRHISHVTCSFITITVFDTGGLRASSISWRGISSSRHYSNCRV